MKPFVIWTALLALLLVIGNIEPNPGPKLKCGSCLKTLGKATKQETPFYCTICGWVHFACSGLKNKSEYQADSFVCTKCCKERIVSQNLTENDSLRKVHHAYTNPKSLSAYSSVQSLCKSTGLPESTVRNYLSSSSTWTKFHPVRNNFQRLKVQSYRLNEIWSVDLADMQLLASKNRGIRFLLVAVDTLSRFLRVEPIKNKSATTTKLALARMLSKAKLQPEKIWTDARKEFLGSFNAFCRKRGIEVYQTYNEKKSAFAERNIRSLKALIYRFMHENHSNSYLDQLQNFVKL